MRVVPKDKYLVLPSDSWQQHQEEHYISMQIHAHATSKETASIHEPSATATPPSSTTSYYQTTSQHAFLNEVSDLHHSREDMPETPSASAPFAPEFQASAYFARQPTAKPTQKFLFLRPTPQPTEKFLFTSLPPTPNIYQNELQDLNAPVAAAPVQGAKHIEPSIHPSAHPYTNKFESWAYSNVQANQGYSTPYPTRNNLFPTPPTPAPSPHPTTAPTMNFPTQVTTTFPTAQETLEQIPPFIDYSR